MFAVLFEKSATPQILPLSAPAVLPGVARLPPAVRAARRRHRPHAPQRVYPFVQGMQSVLDEVRDEATADEIVKRIAEVRDRAPRPSVDQRALDLLEVLVERRAAEVQNQPGPHAQKALAALVRASKGDVVARRAAADGRLPRRPGQDLAAGARRGTTAAIEGPARRGGARFRSTGCTSPTAMRTTLSNYGRRADAIDLLASGARRIPGGQRRRAAGRRPTMPSPPSFASSKDARPFRARRESPARTARAPGPRRSSAAG